MHKNTKQGSDVSRREEWREAVGPSHRKFCLTRWINKKHKLIPSHCAVGVSGGPAAAIQLCCETLMPLDAWSGAWAFSLRCGCGCEQRVFSTRIHIHQTNRSIWREKVIFLTFKKHQDTGGWQMGILASYLRGGGGCGQNSSHCFFLNLKYSKLSSSIQMLLGDYMVLFFTF